MSGRTSLGNPVANRPRARPGCRMARQPQRSVMHVPDNVATWKRLGVVGSTTPALLRTFCRLRCDQRSLICTPRWGDRPQSANEWLLEACAFPNVDLHINCLLLLRNMAPTPPTVRVVHADQTKKCAEKFAVSGASPPGRHRCTPQTCTAETATCRSSATIKGFGRSLTEGNRRKNINFHAFTRGLSLSLPSRVGKQQLSTHGYWDPP